LKKREEVYEKRREQNLDNRRLRKGRIKGASAPEMLPGREDGRQINCKKRKNFGQPGQNQPSRKPRRTSKEG